MRWLRYYRGWNDTWFVVQNVGTTDCLTQKTGGDLTLAPCTFDENQVFQFQDYDRDGGVELYNSYASRLQHIGPSSEFVLANY